MFPSLYTRVYINTYEFHLVVVGFISILAKLSSPTALRRSNDAATKQSKEE